MSAELGRLERVELRDVWLSEPRDFTPWLAREENLGELAKTIGMELAPESTEEPVGSFSADLFCKDVADSSWVVIENQLEKTDHTHLGQLMTYAAGLQADTCIWIAKQFNEQHRAAIAWLNEITDQNFRFFALEVELWRIGMSPPAPKFNIVAEPNDWSRKVKHAANRIDETQISETGKQYRLFWTDLFAILKKSEPQLRIPEPKPQHWQPFSIGRTGFERTVKINRQKQFVCVEIFISGPKANIFFALLKEQQDEIENSLGYPLSWEPLSTRKGCRIAIYQEKVDPMRKADWPAQHEWIARHFKQFDEVFRPLIKQLDVGSYEPREEDDQDEAA